MNNKDSRGKMCEHSFSFEIITIQKTIIPRAEVVKEGKELCVEPGARLHGNLLLCDDGKRANVPARKVNLSAKRHLQYGQV